MPRDIIELKLIKELKSFSVVCIVKWRVQYLVACAVPSDVWSA